MPEDVAFISSKSGVETSLDGKVMSVTKKVRTDGFSSLYSRCTLYFIALIADGICDIIPYSAKFWRGKTLTNQQFSTFGEENFGEC